MDEENKQEATTAENNGERNKQEGSTLVESTNAAAERMEKANAETKELLERQELLLAQTRISGRATAGQTPPEPESSNEKWKREAKERYKDTGLDPTPDETPTTYG